MHLFYTPEILPENEFFTLNEQESKHAVKVLRLAENDEVNLIDGKGNFFTAKIVQAHQKHCKLSIIEHIAEYQKRNYELSVAIAPTKNNERTEWFCEKATEIGIDHIFPIVSYHSERKKINPERFEKKIISAIKQSYKAYKPEFHDLQKFKNFVKTDFKGQKFIAHCYEPVNKMYSLKEIYKPEMPVLIMIGPEGDFSKEEIQLAVENGFKEITLGDFRLRTETAALFAVSTVNLCSNFSGK